MPHPPPISPTLLVLAWCASAGCGTSIQAVYDGNVRFEHCMTLDAQPEVKPTIRRACWQEWLDFYTYGQTRDRVVHARRRMRRLGAVSAFVDPAAAGAEPVAIAAPATSASASASAGAGGGRTTSADCLRQCGELADDCDRACSGQVCRKGCATDYRSCLRRCR